MRRCPANQIDVRPAEHRDSYRATGCGFDLHYNCDATPVPDGNGGYQGERSCGARQRMQYEATDGTSHETWFDDEVHSSDRTSVEAVLVRKHKYILIDRFPTTAPPAP